MIWLDRVTLIGFLQCHTCGFLGKWMGSVLFLLETWLIWISW